MKKLNLLRTFVLLTVSMVMFSGCQKDTEDLLIGKWRVVASDEVYYSFGSRRCERFIDDLVGQRFTFMENGTMIWDEGMGIGLVMSWRYDDNKLIVEAEGELLELEITSIDKSTLKLYQDGGCEYGEQEYMKVELARID